MESFEQMCARKTGEYTPPKKTKRNAAGDKACREAVFRREPGCVLCLDCGKPENFVAIEDWAHFHGRKTDKGVDVRQDPRYSTRLCRRHHEMHGRGHSPSLRMLYDEKRKVQVFEIDGIVVTERKI